MATTKEVTVLARYINKKTGVVNYLVRSSDGKSEYCTTIIDGKASGCSCPSHRPCYHMKGLEAKEEARWTEYRQALAKKLAAQYMTTQVVEQVAEKLVTPAATKKVVTKSVQAIAISLNIPVAEVDAIKVIAKDLKQEMKPKHTDFTLPIGPRDTKKDIMKAALTTNRGFSLMR